MNLIDNLVNGDRAHRDNVEAAVAREQERGHEQRQKIESDHLQQSRAIRQNWTDRTEKGVKEIRDHNFRTQQLDAAQNRYFTHTMVTGLQGLNQDFLQFAQNMGAISQGQQVGDQLHHQIGVARMLAQPAESE